MKTEIIANPKYLLDFIYFQRERKRKRKRERETESNSKLKCDMMFLTETPLSTLLSGYMFTWRIIVAVVIALSWQIIQRSN